MHYIQSSDANQSFFWLSSETRVGYDESFTSILQKSVKLPLDFSHLPERAMTEKKEVWDKKNPKKEHHTLTPAEKAKAKKAAKAHGRDKPSLVDNMNAMKK